jgi:hypothetical protein
MHVIPRFDDEPLSDRWLRSAINVPENRRPDPWAPGSGRALPGIQNQLVISPISLVTAIWTVSGNRLNYHYMADCSVLAY